MIIDPSGRYAEMVELIGREAALALCRKYGGQVIYTPAPDRLSENHPLVKTIGWEAAVKLAGSWQGSTCALPYGPEAGIRNELQAQVLDLAGQGISVNGIAKLTGLTNRAVRRIKNRAPRPAARRRREPDPRQLKLFEDLEG